MIATWLSCPKARLEASILSPPRCAHSRGALSLKPSGQALIPPSKAYNTALTS